MELQKQFSHLVENEARDLVKNISRTNGSLSLTTLLEQEVALTVEQIDRLRELQKNQHLSLLRTECYVDTDLMQMEARLPSYSEQRFVERDKFHQRLMAIETERRKQSVFYNDKMQVLQQKLLSLMQKHGQISFHNQKKHEHAKFN